MSLLMTIESGWKSSNVIIYGNHKKLEKFAEKKVDIDLFCGFGAKCDKDFCTKINNDVCVKDVAKFRKCSVPVDPPDQRILGNKKLKKGKEKCEPKRECNDDNEDGLCVCGNDIEDVSSSQLCSHSAICLNEECHFENCEKNGEPKKFHCQCGIVNCSPDTYCSLADLDIPWLQVAEPGNGFCHNKRQCKNQSFKEVNKEECFCGQRKCDANSFCESRTWSCFSEKAE